MVGVFETHVVPSKLWSCFWTQRFKVWHLLPRKLGVFIWDDADRRASLHGWKCHPLQKAEKAVWDLVFWSGTILWTTRACGPALRENGRFSSTLLPISYCVCHVRLSCREVHSRTMAQSLMLVMHQRIRSIHINISRVTSLHLEPLRPLSDQMFFFSSFNSNFTRQSQSHDWTLELARWMMILNRHVLHQPGLPM